ncbi:MAG: hypothetical protein J6562_07280 [Candidatus Schmidhempelia sp.]|nr:hypothetical protein [Candidatus Schmidhempelia sp.]
MINDSLEKIDNLKSVMLDEELIKKISFIGTVQKVFGILNIIGGIISCFGLITAIFGIPLIIAGRKLFLSGRAFKNLAKSGDANNIKKALINLASFWLYNLIYLVIVAICYAIILMVFMQIVHI